jgi:heme/copper-type cytochrome/quinol oxidase subunit 2
VKLLPQIVVPFVLSFAGMAAAADVSQYTLVLKHHVYAPAELKVPANTKFKILLSNQDATPEEFESTDFNRETMVLPGRSITIYVGPLPPGTYKFFGDFHQDTAQGRLIVE